MNYAELLLKITNIAFSVFSLLMAHFIFFAVVGLFFKKTYPQTEKMNRYGIIIPARNEEAVISGLIESVRKNNYPQDMLDIFVIAHNCTDKTAEVARSLGVYVYEYNNPNENTMGYAFKYLFSCIERDFGTQNYDGFFLFNADNILDLNYFRKMNDAFEYYRKSCVITSFRNSKNFGSNLISGLYGIYFAIGCRMESRGRTFLGCSTRVQGTGYVISSKLVKNGWNYVTLTEDWEFSTDQILLGNKIRYCDDAMFYDEQPTTFKIMWRQRVRWSRGHLLVFYARIGQLIKSLFSKKTVHRVSLYDITINILPVTLIWLCLMLCQCLLLFTVPLVDSRISFSDILLGGESFPSGWLFTLVKSAVVSYLTTVLSSVIVFILERKRIKGVSFIKKVLISLLWPLFLLIQTPIDIQAFFSKHLGWKPIPHKDQTAFEEVNLIK